MEGYNRFGEEKVHYYRLPWKSMYVIKPSGHQAHRYNHRLWLAGADPALRALDKCGFAHTFWDSVPMANSAYSSFSHQFSHLPVTPAVGWLKINE